MIIYIQMSGQKEPEVLLVADRDSSLRPINAGKVGNVVHSSDQSPQKAHRYAQKIQKSKLQVFRKPSGFINKYSVGGAAILVVIGMVWLSQQSNDTPAVTGQTTEQATNQIQPRVTPEFAVMSPGGSGVDLLGGYALISPPGETKVYAYADTIAGVPIKVSQQELSSSIGQDANRLRDLANQFNATQEIEADGKPVYIGQSINGPQSVIFTRDNILVLIAADSKIVNDDWVEYIDSLQFQ